MNVLQIALALIAFILFSDNRFTQSFDTETNKFEYNCPQLDTGNVTLRYSIYKRQQSVMLWTSDHVPEQLITRIFAILLRDVFHFNMITINTYNTANQSTIVCKNEVDKLLDIFNKMHAENKLKRTIISFGVWMSSVGHGLIPETVIEAGPLMAPGRFGWFVPKLGMLSNNSQSVDIKLDSDIFKDPRNTFYDTFILAENTSSILERYNENGYKFISPKCANRKCVTLLAEHRCDSMFIEKQIVESESYLNVYWLGTNYRRTIDTLITYYKSENLFENSTLILLHWMPSDIINGNTAFTQFHLPKCEDLYSLQESFCKYELTPILKYVAKPLDCDYENKLLNFLYNFGVTETHIAEILKINGREFFDLEAISKDHYNNVACEWLRNNYHFYQYWIGDKPKTTLSIGGIFPLSGTHRGHHNLVAAVKQAVNAINQSKSILSDYNLVVYQNDCKCKADLVMKIFLHYFNQGNLLGVLGPACSDTIDSIAGISRHTKLAIISYSADGSNFSNRHEYPYVFRTIGSNHQFIDVYLSIMQNMKWKRIATLTEDGLKSTEYISYMETEMNKMDFELIDSIKFIPDITTTEVNRYLSDLKRKRTKIIIADVSNNKLINLVMCEAYKLHMTAYHGFVWFLPHWVSKKWNNVTVENTHTHICSPKQFEMAFEGHFTITYTAFGDPESIMQEGISVKDWLWNSYGNSTSTNISQYTGFVYDAVWAYALAADKLDKSGIKLTEGLGSREAMVDHLVEFIWETDFIGLSGRVRFGQGGSRITQISIMQWIESTFVEVGIFKPIIKGEGKDLFTDGGELILKDNAIQWIMNNQQPSDGSYDCFSGKIFNINCANAELYLIPTTCLIVILITFSLSYFFWKRKYQEKFRSSVKIMKNFGIDFTALHYKKLTSLNKFEIPKDKIVVNRRLGEGAFGNVYGGEALLDEKGWVAVAIKTLKVGASIEDRLDFLSEADAMKCLDHENIIKLLGVCLQTEPIYTVMEYMLYGDLKTYLLSRRNMTYETCDDISDVSPKQLTTYALDIIKGIEYLANQKYIHRDLACRNCLVNSQRVVKLADFGMAKSLLESDYYCFSHKRMLPVRWMAPESLQLGVFTASSDIWSYGVILFEIITFGALPYQCLTNKQVFNYVTSGKTLKLPHGIKSQLSSLIQACLSQESDKRPTASDIITYISNYPRLLTACLDFLNSSIELIDTDFEGMEMLRDGQSFPGTKCYSGSYMSQNVPIRPFDRNNIFSGNVDLSSFNIDDDTIKPPPQSSYSSTTTTPDGYSIMSPLLMNQMNRVSNSPQLNLLKKFTSDNQ